jgi:hypothetical protein
LTLLGTLIALNKLNPFRERDNMRNLLVLLSFIWSVSILCTQVQAKDYEDLGMNNGRSEEGIIKVDLPLPIVKHEITSLLTANGSMIKEVSRFDIDPVKRVLFIDGKLIMPDSLLLTMEETAGDKLMNEHSFSFAIGLPSPSLLSVSRYVQFKIHRFQLDGIDYTKGFNIISRVVPALLSNRSLINYFMDESKAPTDFSDQDLSFMIKNFMDSGVIRFRDNTISIKFNLKNFTDLKRFAYLEELRLWHFSPVLMKGTKDKYAFRIEAGLGKPGKNWVKAAKERQTDDSESIQDSLEAKYKQFAYSSAVSNKLKTLVDTMVSETGIYNWSTREKVEIEEIKGTLSLKATNSLTKKNVDFIADPEESHQRFFKLSKEYAQNAIFDLKRRHVLDVANRNGGRQGMEMPFAKKRLSQKAVNQFTNFFRDFEFDNEQLFSRLDVILAPQFPGVVIRGDVNLNINTLFEMGLEGSGIDFSGPRLRFDDKTYGKSLPFELSLYTYMRDNGVLELDIRNATLGDKFNKVVLTPHNQKGEFLEEFTKMAIVNVLKTYLMSDPLSSTAPEETETPEERRKKLYQKITQYRDKFLSNSKFGNKSLSSNNILDLLKIKEFDLNNPFNETPAQIAEEEVVEFFNKLIGYDRESGRVQIYLDPSVFSEKIFYADNKVQLWNFEPIYDKLMDKTYLELAIGNDTRSTKYLEHLYSRKEKKDSEVFVGTTGIKANEGPIDYNLKLDLREFEATVNAILVGSLAEQNKMLKSTLSQNKESETTILEDLTLKSEKDNTLSLKITMNKTIKKKKNFLARGIDRVFRGDKNKYKVETERSSVTATIYLESVALDKYKSAIIKKSPNEVFLGDSLIKLDLHAIGMKTENPGLFQAAMNLMIGNVNMKSGIVGKNLKRLILKIAGPFLNERGNKNGNTTLGGIHLNKYAKVYTHKSEILLQVNPRFSGPVWDFVLLTNKKHKGRKIGLNIDKQTNILNLDFVSAFTPSTVDKIELYKIMKESIDITKRANETRNLESTQDLLSIYDDLFYNSDKTKKSIFHRFVDVVNNYEELSMIGLQDQNIEFSNENGYNFTSAGAELMHIVVTAQSIVTAIDQVSGLRVPNQSLKYERQMKDIKDKLINQFINPLTKVYGEKYKKNNERILRKDVTDWNHLVYPDALFSHKIYEYLESVQ